MVIEKRLSTYIDSLSWDIPEYLQEVEKDAVMAEVPVIKRSTQTLLAFLLDMAKPAAVLEIGTAVGFSSMLVSEYTKESTIIDTIEKVPARIKCAKENFKKYNKESRINLIEGEASEILELLASQGKKYNFVFMDAAKGQYIKFFEKFENYLNPGGIIITDNLKFHGLVEKKEEIESRNVRGLVNKIEKYVDFLKQNEEYITKFYDIGDGISVSFRKNDENVKNFD